MCESLSSRLLLAYSKFCWAEVNNKLANEFPSLAARAQPSSSREIQSHNMISSSSIPGGLYSAIVRGSPLGGPSRGTEAPVAQTNIKVTHKDTTTNIGVMSSQTGASKEEAFIFYFNQQYLCTEHFLYTLPSNRCQGGKTSVRNSPWIKREIKKPIQVNVLVHVLRFF